MRKMLHESFQDADEFLTAEEMKQLNDLKGQPEEDLASQDALKGLLSMATQRRIEARIDEQLAKEMDVLVRGNKCTARSKEGEDE